jgi:pilus assembly protein Flp/PilA
MAALRNLLVNLVKDENGAAVIEYAVVCGLVVVACIAAVAALGGKILTRWNSISAQIH